MPPQSTADGHVGPVDVAIIGGGIIGCSTAYWLARRGARVALFERSRVASEQSSRAWGFIRRQGRHSAEMPLAAEAIGLWNDLAERFGVAATGFTRGGILIPAETEEDEERVAGNFETARRFGLDVCMLNAAEVRRLVPEIGGDWRSGLYTAGDAHGDPALSTHTIATAARAAGAAIYENTPVLAIEDSADRPYVVAVGGGRCEAKAVVLANGIGAHVLSAPLGHELPIQIVKSSVGQTRPAAPFTKVAMWGPNVAYRPGLDGRFILENGYRGVGVDYEITIDSFRALRHFLPAYRNNWRPMRVTLGADFLHQLRSRASRAAAVQAFPEPRPNRRKVVSNLESFRRLFAHLKTIELESAWAGRLDMTPDVIPIIDRPNPAQDLFIAAGFSGHGFALGPSIGKQLSEWILDGRPSLDLSPFRLSRFRDGIVHKSQKAF